MTFDEWFSKEYHEPISQYAASDGLRELLKEAWNAAKDSGGEAPPSVPTLGLTALGLVIDPSNYDKIDKELVEHLAVFVYPEITGEAALKWALGEYVEESK